METPKTVPDELIVATDVLPLVQAPPEVPSVSVVEPDEQSVVVPLIAATDGAPLTVIDFIAYTEPQLFETR